MPLLFIEKETETKAKVTTIHYKPELLSGEQRAKGIEVDNIPDAEEQQGKSAVLYYNPKTNELFHEYVDRPLTEEERLTRIEEENLDLWDLLLFGGAD